jgi:hypothetical protein
MEYCGMIRKSMIVALGFLGLFALGTMASTTPASAGYACGPWNGWCSWYGQGHGWKGHGYPQWGHYGHNRHWGGDWHRGGGKKAYRGGGKKKHHAHRKGNKRYYR